MLERGKGSRREERLYSKTDKRKKKRGSCCKYYNHYQTCNTLVKRKIVYREKEREGIKQCSAE
jgi:hypothetical protein